jgi:SAM-dependent methyltransferase
MSEATPVSAALYDVIWQMHEAERYAGRTPDIAVKFQAFAALPEPLESYFQDRVVLDAGCGQGRFSYLASMLGARHVVAVDQSHEALVRARRATGEPKNCLFIQADLDALPLRAEAFDYVMSFGVLHHTPSTRRALERLIALLKPGGLVSIYVYRRFSIPAVVWPLRLLTLRLPADRVRRACERLGIRYAGRRSRWPLLRRITFEELTTPYLWTHSVREVVGWLRDAGLQVISTTQAVSASARRPPR